MLTAWHCGTSIPKLKASTEVRITEGWMCCSREQVSSIERETSAKHQNFSGSRQVLGGGTYLNLIFFTSHIYANTSVGWRKIKCYLNSLLRK